VRKNCRICHFI